jgi:mRNA-degrading endonuclease RelE of RelBE toxin-antitoxin system
MRSTIYEVRLLRETADALDDIDPQAYPELARDIDSLAFAPRREDAAELGEGFWLLKSREFAIVYAIDDQRMVVLLVWVGRQEGILKSLRGRD